jgi:glycine hydroxymethyltransferase
MSTGADSPPVSRTWLPELARQREDGIRQTAAATSLATLAAQLERLIGRNREIHERECINLNPATNVMNPRAEAALAAGLGSRPSLGYAGAKYETGLEAIEEIEVLAADLACRVFDSSYAEVRVGSGALANAYAFLATCRPGDRILVPPAGIGGHVTHNRGGVAGLLGLEIHELPIDGGAYAVDVAAVAELARRLRPRLITIGGSLNLAPHPVGELRAIADEVGALLLFDAAHVCGLIAGGVWPNPLAQGAHLMTMSTYKSLGGPPGGLLVTDDAGLAERIDAIAFPGLTANFDAGKTAALAIGLLDWLACGPAYASAMVSHAAVLADAMLERGLPVFTTAAGATATHQFALDATAWGGGQGAADRLRQANILACAIGLPGRPAMAGLRVGTPEVVRWGMTEEDMTAVADLVHRALHGDPRAVAASTTALRSRYTDVHYTRDRAAPGGALSGRDGPRADPARA